MKIKRFLHRFNITVLCLMSVHMLLPPLILWFLEATISFDWLWYVQLYVVGFVCEQLYTAATEQESKPVKRMRILSVIFAVCSSVHIQIVSPLLRFDVFEWYTILLVGVWSLWLWVETRKMDPEKKIQNIVNCVLTVIYVLHVAVDILLRYVDGDASHYSNPIVFITSHVENILWYYLPWVILINMAFLAVRTYRDMSDD